MKLGTHVSIEGPKSIANGLYLGDVSYQGRERSVVGIKLDDVEYPCLVDLDAKIHQVRKPSTASQRHANQIIASTMGRSYEMPRTSYSWPSMMNLSLGYSPAKGEFDLGNPTVGSVVAITPESSVVTDHAFAYCGLIGEHWLLWDLDGGSEEIDFVNGKFGNERGWRFMSYFNLMGQKCPVYIVDPFLTSLVWRPLVDTNAWWLDMPLESICNGVRFEAKFKPSSGAMVSYMRKVGRYLGHVDGVRILSFPVEKGRPILGRIMSMPKENTNGQEDRDILLISGNEKIKMLDPGGIYDRENAISMLDIIARSGLR